MKGDDKLVVFICFLLVIEFGLVLSQELDKNRTDADNDDADWERVRKLYSSGQGTSSRQQSTKYSSKSSGVKGTKTQSSSSSGNVTIFEGGCVSGPKAPLNSKMQCLAYSGCRITCHKDYRFPNGETLMYMVCEDGEWKVQQTELENAPHCEPICEPPCQNGGMCISPHQCQCPHNYYGVVCEHNKMPCLNRPPLPTNSRRLCNSRTCTITCSEGYRFPDGSAVTNMLCTGGNWVPSRSDWTSVPDCEPICDPPCENGGVCLTVDFCQCPQSFRGPQCQYSEDACTVAKLKFNGGYKCTGTSDTLSCSISCPSGTTFEYEPAKLYVCKYSDGFFTPEPPQCVSLNNEVEIIPGGSSHQIHQIHHVQSSSSHSDSSSSVHQVNVDWSWSNSSSWSSSSQHHGSSHGQSSYRPSPGSCYSWRRDHYKTFDGRVLSFKSECSYTLLHDSADNTISISLEKKPNHQNIILYFQDKKYSLMLNDENIPILAVGSRRFSIPIRLSGITVKFLSHYIELTVTSLEVSVLWDGKNFVSVNVKENMWNKTVGICGRFDGYQDNDMESKYGSQTKTLETFIESWKSDTLEENCQSIVSENPPCDSDSNSVRKHDLDATQFCSVLLNDARFSSCRAIVDTNLYYEACKWDYCACEYSEKRHCACDSLSVYARECKRLGAESLESWRDNSTCPITCSGGRVYQSCGPAMQESCNSVEEVQMETGKCEEGCFCPSGTVLHEQKCISKDECPCQLRGKTYAAGESVPKDCNTCTCTNGKWICTQAHCTARCSAVGDPHYITFDGRHYDFMGKCSYYLMKGDNFSIESENIGCAGAISQDLGFLGTSSSASCTRAIIIRLGERFIKLSQNREVFVNGQVISLLPFTMDGANIRVGSSIFLIVELPNGLEIYWDGMSRIYIDAPSSLQGATKGLCGTFNLNQKDDFLTPEGDIEQSAVEFANKWKTSEICEDTENVVSDHPCDINIHNKDTAVKHCSKLKGTLFQDCHWVVNHETYYDDCLYDLCSCEGEIGKCLCPILAAYAKECSDKGIMVDFRSDIQECAVTCPTSQKYQVCGNSCTRSCFDISQNSQCKTQCVEGCNCIEGHTINSRGECIPIEQCSCVNHGVEYPAGHKEIRPGSKGLQLCVCRNAVWDCELASYRDIEQYPMSGNVTCRASSNEEFTICEPEQPITCKNMHSPPESTQAACTPGCKCKKGFVLDIYTKRCIPPHECPCHHGGKSYSEGSTIQEDCNTCKCTSGIWQCSEKPCAAVCTAWGDSHFKTFDGKIYDFQGTCDYILAKGNLGANDIFDISIYNVPCGTSGVTCSKSVTLRVGAGDKQEVITLTRDEPLPPFTGFDRITIREAGLFVFVEVYDLKLVLQWDKGTRIYVKADPQWKNKVKGLCGNYNDNDLDDFQTPSGGISEISPILFGDSWKTQPNCPNSLDIKDTCQQHPSRKVWALQKCGILKSSVFQPCHSEVPVEPYLDRCIFDSCACDFGGDCECLCTAIATYAQECNIHGVPIKWRSQELCPIQCDESCSHYSACIKTCPKQTCDNHLVYKSVTPLCHEDTCVEGCEVKPCPPGEVYYNLTTLECIPLNQCPTLCLQVGDVIYKEGDILEQDACHTCYCSRSKKICQGKPCPESPITSTIAATPVPAGYLCRSGWTSWINSNIPGKSNTENEPPPSVEDQFSSRSSGVCEDKDMVSIECRDVRTHLSYEHYKEKEYNVTCSLEMNGLQCWGTCPDFEVRVFCNCVGSELPTAARYISSTNTPTTTESAVTRSVPLLPTTCDVARPNVPHPSDCYIFYQCQLTTTGSQYVEKTCGPDMMYNPQTMTCDWKHTVLEMRPECGSKCPDSSVWSDCAYSCNQLCEFYEHTSKLKGYCKRTQDCIPGCLPSYMISGCPTGHLWRDEQTCVPADDCTCVSRQGNVVKPGMVMHEDSHPCEICQCVGNTYVCDNSSLCTTASPYTATTVLPDTTPEVYTYTMKTVSVPKNDSHIIVTEDISATVIIVPSTVTPPQDCAYELIDLLDGPHALKSVTFDASSSLNSYFSPESSLGTISESSAGSWIAAHQNQDQYLQINLGEVEHVYGVVLQGNPLADEYVTSYKVLYSMKGDRYSYVTDENNMPAVFRGPINRNDPIKQVFHHPIEAQYVRINPQTWVGAIAVRVELLGCGTDITSTTIQTTSPSTLDECTDTMGLESGTVSDQQLTASSFLYRNGNLFEPSQARLHSKQDETHTGGWAPSTASQNEWIQVNFLEPRNISGIITQGENSGDNWVEGFEVMYSSDGKVWNSILGSSGNKMMFFGNYDSNSPRKNTFDRLIRTQYIRIIPMKWHHYPVLRFDIIGCYSPYPTLPPTYFSTPSTTPSWSETCNPCPSLPHDMVDADMCHCDVGEWWDGARCTSRAQCPCYIGHIRYDIGAVFFSEDCEMCRCELYGITKCASKQSCAQCDEGLQSVLTPSCACLCKPCPPHTVLCPTSNVCINSAVWCDGIEDCSDDEIDCKITTTSPTTVHQPILFPCPPRECPPGYEMLEIPRDKYAKFEPMDETPTKHPSGIKGSPRKNGIKGSPRKNGIKGRKTIKKSNSIKGTKGPQHGKPQNPVQCIMTYECVPSNNLVNCSKPKCPEGYTIAPVENQEGTKRPCIEYICKPPAAVCEVSGRTFNTFDNTEYKYDICDHILVRDRDDLQWEIALLKNCSSGVSCTQQLMFLDDDHEMTFYSDLNIKFDGYDYTPQQIERIGTQYSTFSLSQLGDSLYFESFQYGFRIKWDIHSNLKIWVNGDLAGHIDGLCGFFNGRREDDKLTLNGSTARTSVEFGDSWRNPTNPFACQVTECPESVQSLALKLCSSVRDKPLASCHSAVKTEKFLSECIDFACACLENEGTEDECRCQVIQNYVTQCQEEDQTVDISSWRTQLNCPIFCPEHLVYRECYKHRCELSCDNLRDEVPCPAVSNVCFTGCFCPDGLVRKGTSCVKPVECRDCICNGFGGSQYVSFDRSNYTFNGNCTYIAVQDKTTHNDHQYQVLVTNTQCKHSPSSTCVTGITVIYENHIVNIMRNEPHQQLELLLDGVQIETFPHSIEWLQIEGSESTRLTVLIPRIQVEVSYVYNNYAFIIQLPSQLYGGKMEGLCGDCNYDQTDDFRTSSNVITQDVNEFGNSWLSGTSHNDNCGYVVEPPISCVIPPEQDICEKLLDSSRFGKCHYVVDTDSYVEACRNDMCNSEDATGAACNVLSAYASECLHEGICLDWRSEHFCPYHCHSGLQYHACKIGCAETCDNFESLRQHPEDCHVNPTEGCFCPGRQVLHNGTCIDENHCLVCDDEGHHSGDTWHPDKCTTCTCKGNSRQCEVTECVPLDRICEQSMLPIVVRGTEDRCCPEYTCVPISTTYPTPATCPEVKKPECSSDQVLRVQTQHDGCQTFVCECKPQSECELLLEDEPELPPGMVRVFNDSGCCPHYSTHCDVAKCPSPLPCKKFYNAVTMPPASNECCSQVKCEPPEDVCLYEYSYEADPKGGEKERNFTDKFTAVKQPGSEWKDGPCRTCHCTGAGPYEAVCSVESCRTANIDEEISEYVLQEVHTYDHCCPNTVRVKCRDKHNVYEAGEKWSSEKDPCQKFVCAEMPDGSVKKETMITVCDERCGLGYIYEAPVHSTECCGHCKQVSCVVDGVVHDVNSEWGTEDHCTLYTCTNVNNSLVVSAVAIQCPEILPDDLANYEIEQIPVAHQCCKKIRKTKCKEDTVTYEIGTTWTSSTNRCVNISCVSEESSGQAQKVETVLKCVEECDKGWEYIPSPNHSKECCGKCEQVACVDDFGHLHKPGESWKENCTTYECKKQLTQFQIVSMHETCPSTDSCAEDQLYQDKCCWKCNTTVPTSKLNCQPEEWAMERTVNLIHHAERSHGNCTNLWPIENFHECRGNCESFTYYDPNTVHHESNCKCCQAVQFKALKVNLTCEDGFSVVKHIAVPSQCSCMSCGEGEQIKTTTASEHLIVNEVVPEGEVEIPEGEVEIPEGEVEFHGIKDADQ